MPTQNVSFGLAVLFFTTSSFAADPPTPGTWTKPKEFQVPKGNWQVPGEIKQPTGPWQVPKGIQAIKTSEPVKCQKNFSIGSDALFEFDKDSLSADAEETLHALGPLISESEPVSAAIEGHTDSKGSDEYNERLSVRRADTVKAWLVTHGFLKVPAAIKGHGEKLPIESNSSSDGEDNPEGRQANRRVEILLKTCEW